MTDHEQAVNLDDCKAGKRYRVTLSDCCIQGHFEAAVVSKNYDEDDYLRDVTFSNGVTLDGIAVELAEVAERQADA